MRGEEKTTAGDEGSDAAAASGRIGESLSHDSSLLTPHPSLPPRGPLLGIDYGTKRIGLAVCDPDRVIASPLGTQANDSSKEAYFTQLVTQSKFVGIVVGLPLHANGDESEMSRQAREFAKWLANLTKLPVVMWDERCTSAAAEDALLEAKLTKKKRKARVDRVAAQMILQSFIDAKCPAGGSDAVFTKPTSGEDAPGPTSN